MSAGGTDARPLDHWGAAFDDYLHCHATAVALSGQGALFLGVSGSGKSGLALTLMAHGASLISDDAVWVRVTDGVLTLHRPQGAPEMIEARHIGLLAAGPTVSGVPLRVAVDLESAEPHRLPPRRTIAWRGAEADLILGAGTPNLWAGLITQLRGGRVA